MGLSNTMLLFFRFHTQEINNVSMDLMQKKVVEDFILKRIHILYCQSTTVYKQAGRKCKEDAQGINT